MKTLMLLAALCLVLCVVLPQTDAKSCHWVTITRCYLVKRNGRWYRFCIIVSRRRVCVTKRGQIGDNQGRLKSTTKGPEKAFFEKFQHKFSTYDKDSDKNITFHEFRTTLGDVHDRKTLQKVFRATDENGDDAITCDEFLKAKFDFSQKAVCQ